MKIAPEHLRAMKQRRERIAALTVYDYPTTRLLDECGVPLLLVGDSVGMVVLGYPDTTEVTMADMEHHVRAAARAKPHALLAADLPYGTCVDAETALHSARRLIAAGAEAVKGEGGAEIAPAVRAIIAAGIPFIGHLGMLPQRVREEGGYHLKGRTPSERDSLLADAALLERAGACAVVLELVAPTVAQAITQRLSIPSIGIGSGRDCDGQILVTHDLLGIFPWFRPKFVRPEMDGATQMRAAIERWMRSL